MNETLVQAVADRVERLLAREQEKPRVLLLGEPPPEDLGYQYVSQAPYSALLIGSLTYSQLLFFREEAVFSALAEGLPVYLWARGLPHRKGPCRSRPLLSRLARAERELRALGVLFLDSPARRRFISGEEAKRLLLTGSAPPEGAILSPLARDILERERKDRP